nr:Ig-like domain-containing protein [Gemmatimonadaceae bacterium]
MHPPVKVRAFGAFALLTVSLTLIASCSSDRVISIPVPGAARADVDVKPSKDSVQLMVRTPTAERGARGGSTVQLDAAVFNPQGMELEHKKKVYWSSLDTLIATVDTSGLVTAQGVGTTYVIVDHKKGLDSVRVVVIPVPVAAIRITGVDSLSLGDTASFSAATLDSVGVPLEGRVVTWSSLATGIATVSAQGEVIAVGVGSTEISASAEGKTATQALRVWPQPIATITVDPASVSVPQFHKVRYTAIARDRRGNILTDRSITWSSSAPAVFYIKANADTAAGKDLGNAVVSATAEGKSGTSDVTVTNPVEARALWVTRFEFTTSSAVDFPKIATIFQKAASANFNVVYFQV